MELGLSLGESSTQFGFSANGRAVTNTTATAANGGLGLCMALGINSNGREEQQRAKVSVRIDGGDERVSAADPPLQLDLLPLVPVRGLSWPSDNGSSEGVSSGRAGRGFDVNRLPPPAEEVEEGAAVSSPNSVASSFQMDFCMYRGAKRGSSEAAAAGEDVGEAERASSRASDEDENGVSRKKLRLSKEQSAYLEESFKEHNTLNPKQKLALAKQLNLRPRQVEVWFQNRRARTKLKQTEVDCEYLKRCCETLTEENRRLHKELQELRALKSTSNPFYMQLPATTLTMCPSCERVATATATATPTTTTSTAPAAAITTDPAGPGSSKSTGPFPLSRPRFFSFPQTQPATHQSAAS